MCFLITAKVQDSRAAFSSKIYQEWDKDTSLSPAKTRPPSQMVEVPSSQALGLQLVAMDGGQPVFPLQTLVRRFAEGSPEIEAVKLMKATFDKTFPEAARAALKASSKTGAGSPGPNRAQGSCDYTVDGGAEPLDPSRVLDLRYQPMAEFTAEKLGTLVGRSGRPTVVIDKDHQIWLLNTTEEELEVLPGELFGFGCGDYQNSICNLAFGVATGLRFR